VSLCYKIHDAAGVRISDTMWRVREYAPRYGGTMLRVSPSIDRVEGGGWRVEGGGSRVEGGGWRVEGRGWKPERRVSASIWRVEGVMRHDMEDGGCQPPSTMWRVTASTSWRIF